MINWEDEVIIMTQLPTNLPLQLGMQTRKNMYIVPSIQI